MDSVFQKRLLDFAADDLSGSSELADEALNIITDFCRISPLENLKSSLSEITRSLIEGQPSMAAVLNTVFNAEKVVLQMIEQENIGEITANLEKLSERRKLEERQLINRSSSHLEKFTSVSTYSRSSLVEKSLLQLARNGFRAEIFVSESRPGNEGITLAESLSDAGLNVKICTDAALPGLIIQSEAFVIGADAIKPDGFCNKIGTSMMCRIAIDNGIPVKLIATYDKFLPEEMSSGFIIKDQPTEEIYNGEKRNIRVFNRLFEWCENRLVNDFILPGGINKPNQLVKMFRRLNDG